MATRENSTSQNNAWQNIALMCTDVPLSSEKIGNTSIIGDSEASPLPILPEGGGRLYTG